MKIKHAIFGTCVLAASFTSLQAASLQIGMQAVTNPSAGNNPNVWPSSGGESPANAIDGVLTNKYLNFGEVNTGFIVTLGSAMVFNGATFTTGNDAEPRDPASFSVWGSNTAVASSVPGTLFDLSTFTLLTNAQALSLPVGRNTTSAPVSWTNSTAFTTYVIAFPTVKDSVSANSMQISEVTFQTGGVSQNIAGSSIGGGQIVVPEPGSIALLALATVGLFRRRRL